MRTRFDIAKKRPVCGAGFNFYPNPTPHPTRLLTEHDFIYLTEGAWNIRVGDELLCGKKDDVMILPAGIPHYAAGDCAAGTRTIFIHTPGVFGDGRTIEAEAQADADESDYVITLPGIANAAHAPKVREAFQRAALAFLRGDRCEASCWFDVMVCALATLKSESDRKSELVSRIKELIVSASESVPPSNEAIARQLGVSVRTAETAFRSVTGTTIHAYANAFRIERARYYLESFPGMKMRDIAYALGYYDEYHFSRAFRAACGLSPTAYRESVLSGKPPEIPPPSLLPDA